jgi:uncharacterized protein (DUF4415 family)
LGEEGWLMEPGKMRGKRAENYHYMADAMRRLEWDLHHRIEATGRIPLEWHEIAQTPVKPGADRVALRLDRDVMRFFRSIGPGYGPRINLVLRTYMHARLAGVIRGAETAPEFRFAMAPERPLLGETAAGLGAGPGPDAAEQAADAAARVAERVKAALGERVQEVRVSQRLTTSPACLVAGEHDPGRHLERLLKATGQELQVPGCTFENPGGGLSWHDMKKAGVEDSGPKV